MLSDRARDWLWNSYSGKRLLDKYGNIQGQEGYFRILGEDSNADMGGSNHQPTLATCYGALVDVINYAVELPRWTTWGAGGDIEPITVIRIDENSASALKDKRERKEQLKQELDRIENELKNLE